jgi:cytochrome b involved in lipid metabolism
MAEAAAKVIPRTEVAEHNKAEDCWIVINGKVYNVSPYLSEHPGGPEIILDQAGKDASEDFEDTGHSPEARATLKKFYVGDAEGPAPGKAGQARSGGAKAESGPSMLTIILVLLVLLGGAYFAFAPAGAADKAEL